jgi:hypothetical protein
MWVSKVLIFLLSTHASNKLELSKSLASMHPLILSNAYVHLDYYNDF